MSQLNPHPPSCNADGFPLRSTPWARPSRKELKDDKTRVPHPSHRHASPSAPWPWVDLEDDVDKNQLECPLPPIPALCDHKNCENCYTGYPQSRFPNWTYRQVTKSKIHNAIHDRIEDKICVLHRVDVDSSGLFTNPGPLVAAPIRDACTWQELTGDKRPNAIRVRAMFIENMSGPVLQMLGAKYNIEPFFWSSSLNWIPSRFQEEIQPGIGDHITITLTFLRSVSYENALKLKVAFRESTDTLQAPDTRLGSQRIDPHAPLALYSNNSLLVLDLLAVHLIRNKNGSTILSFHPDLDMLTTTAAFLHERIRFAGQSVYWQSIFQKSPDPTFVLLTFIWHAIYAWDGALETMYDHICTLETRVISKGKYDSMPLTKELHIIRAHHLHYSSLLDDLHKHIVFISDTNNPAMASATEEELEYTKVTMKRECQNLLTEVARLKSEVDMQERRLKNVMGLVFSTVNIEESFYTRTMMQAGVRDSAAMKQIAYLTMFFLPASFVAGVFGMNISEINPGTFGSVHVYVAIALPLTIVTAWIIMAFQSQYILPENKSFFKRLGWPVYLVIKMMDKKKPGKNSIKDDGSDYSYNTSMDLLGPSRRRSDTCSV